MTKNKEKNFISAVVYVHNSEDKLKKFLPELCQILSNNFEKFEVICVNDASSEESKKAIESIFKDIGITTASIINMSFFSGTELSMTAGMDLAIGDFVYEFDSLIFDYNTTLILDVYQKMLEGYDIVSAAPDRQRGGIGSKLFYSIFNKYHFIDTPPVQHECFRLLSRRAINRAKSLNKALVYRKAVYASCGLKQTVLSYHSTCRKRTLDKFEKNNRMELAIDSLILFTNTVQNLSLYTSMAFLAMTVMIGIYSWGIYFGNRKPVEGWTPLMLFLSLGFFGIFFILTITLKYLAVILKLIFRRKQYLIESVEKITNN